MKPSVWAPNLAMFGNTDANCAAGTPSHAARVPRTALHCAADNQVMTAPAVVGSGAARLQRSAEVREREAGDPIGDPHLLGRVDGFHAVRGDLHEAADQAGLPVGRPVSMGAVYFVFRG